MPKVSPGNEGRKNNEEVGEPIQLPDEQQQQPQRGDKDQQRQTNR